jgi:hypothetical protein
MDKREVRISQSGFARMQETLLRSECEGYGPDACAAHALHSVGLGAKPGVETVLIVDPTLDGPIYPFMEWPAELRAKSGHQ